MVERRQLPVGQAQSRLRLGQFRDIERYPPQERGVALQDGKLDRLVSVPARASLQLLDHEQRLFLGQHALVVAADALALGPGPDLLRHPPEHLLPPEAQLRGKPLVDVEQPPMGILDIGDAGQVFHEAHEALLTGLQHAGGLTLGSDIGRHRDKPSPLRRKRRDVKMPPHGLDIGLKRHPLTSQRHASISLQERASPARVHLGCQFAHHLRLRQVQLRLVGFVDIEDAIIRGLAGLVQHQLVDRHDLAHRLEKRTDAHLAGPQCTLRKFPLLDVAHDRKDAGAASDLRLSERNLRPERSPIATMRYELEDLVFARLRRLEPPGDLLRRLAGNGQVKRGRPVPARLGLVGVAIHREHRLIHIQDGPVLRVVDDERLPRCVKDLRIILLTGAQRRRRALLFRHIAHDPVQRAPGGVVLRHAEDVGHHAIARAADPILHPVRLAALDQVGDRSIKHRPVLRQRHADDLVVGALTTVRQPIDAGGLGRGPHGFLLKIDRPATERRDALGILQPVMTAFQRLLGTPPPRHLLFELCQSPFGTVLRLDGIVHQVECGDAGLLVGGVRIGQRPRTLGHTRLHLCLRSQELVALLPLGQVGRRDGKRRPGALRQRHEGEKQRAPSPRGASDTQFSHTSPRRPRMQHRRENHLLGGRDALGQRQPDGILARNAQPLGQPDIGVQDRPVGGDQRRSLPALLDERAVHRRFACIRVIRRRSSTQLAQLRLSRRELGAEQV
ncbi:MAG: hypothetical protein BWX86_01259 [Verrucomicrobia bacterium ADurb.Bin122]|nr:MAG: hypothetical protein BWX86_01259 [Verrucomicrobia bacterium ADurb.Bin122]